MLDETEAYPLSTKSNLKYGVLGVKEKKQEEKKKVDSNEPQTEANLKGNAQIV